MSGFEETLKAKRKLCKEFEKKGVKKSLFASALIEPRRQENADPSIKPTDFLVVVGLNREPKPKQAERIREAHRKVRKETLQNVPVEFRVDGKPSKALAPQRQARG